MSPADVAAALPGVDIGEIESVEHLKHGLTNESWLVRTERDALVIRRSNSAEESLQINRASEAAILATVARADIGPEVIRCDPAQHILVTRYAGATWAESDALEPENIKRIANLLRRLHALQPPAGAQHVDLGVAIDGYLSTLDAHGVNCAIAAPALRRRAREIAATLKQDVIACLCHNDIHALNIIDDGSLRLIDWEYAGLGERFFDLASLCVYHRYDRRQREQLLAAYAKRADTAQPDAQQWHRLELACWLFDYVRDLWTEVREGLPGPVVPA